MLYLLAVLYAGLWVILLGNLWYLRKQPSVPPLPSRPPTVSILIPARNEAQNLQRLLPSVLRQTYPSFEVIVYDDGSTDETGAVLQQYQDPRLHTLRGEGPPPGWIGKVHALYQAARKAKSKLYLFLDADAELADADALSRLIQKYLALPADALLTGLPRLTGRGLLLVSLVPYAILTSLPWPLMRQPSVPGLGALNGQCWMISADKYHHYEPHEHLKDEILEDVEIGRLMRRNGIYPVMADIKSELSVRMYDSFWDAWRGFRKNAYLVMGGKLTSFIPIYGVFILLFLIVPYLHPAFFMSFMALKACTDRIAGFPLRISLLAPLSFFLAVILGADSAQSHMRGTVSWKGRSVRK